MIIRNLFLGTVTTLLAMALIGCEAGPTNSNTNANANANTSMRAEATPTATATPKYSEEDARKERERAKANKETVGQSLEDAWIHTKIVAKLIGDADTPERKINVDVVDGAVTLRGTVDTAEGKSEAERIAKETDGVKKVTNQLKVVPAKAVNTKKSANTNKPAPAKTKTP